LEVNHDLFQPTLNEQIAKPRKHALIQQINQWEKNSMNKIWQTAEKIRQLLLKHITQMTIQIEEKLSKLTHQL
jgi:hypothetical protein